MVCYHYISLKFLIYIINRNINSPLKNKDLIKNIFNYLDLDDKYSIIYLSKDINFLHKFNKLGKKKNKNNNDENNKNNKNKQLIKQLSSLDLNNETLIFAKSYNILDLPYYYDDDGHFHMNIKYIKFQY